MGKVRDVSLEKGYDKGIICMSLQHMNENAENKPKWIRQNLTNRKFLVKLPKNRVPIFTNRIGEMRKKAKTIVIL